MYLHYIEYKEIGGSKYTSTLKYASGLPVLDLETEKKISKVSVLIVSNLEKMYWQFVNEIEIEYVRDENDQIWIT